jgi:branched-chain amino acid transport system substrate-binding protein
LSKHRLRALALALGILGAGQAGAAEALDIDVILPLTGGTAFLGKAEQNALQIYEKEIEATGGVHGKAVHFTFLDDQSNPQTAVQLMNQVKGSNSPVILGSAAVALCNAMAPLVRRGPVMYCFSPGIYPAAGSYVFSTSVSTKGLAGALLRYFGDRGLKHIALITSTDATGQDALKNIKALVASDAHKGMEIVGEAQFNPTDMSVAAQIQRLKGNKPDAIIAWSTGGPIGTVFKAMQDAGIDVPVGTTDGNMTYAQMEQYAAFLPKDLYIPSPEWPRAKGETQSPVLAAKNTFYKAYEKAGVKPDGPASFAWDPAVIVIEALRKLPPNASADDLKAYLDGLVGFNGINGPYDFKSEPNRGLGEANVVVTRWDPKADAWTVASAPGGALLKN